MNAYIILCTNGDDTFVTLIDQGTWDWFQKRIASPGEDIGNPPEDQILGSMKSNGWGREEAIQQLNGYASSRSYANDIALMLSGSSFNGEFFTEGGLPGVFSFAQQHDLVVAGAYEGLIY